MVAPFNFMISKDWWENKRVEYLDVTGDWGQWDDAVYAPEGFPLAEGGQNLTPELEEGGADQSSLEGEGSGT